MNVLFGALSLVVAGYPLVDEVVRQPRMVPVYPSVLSADWPDRKISVKFHYDRQREEYSLLEVMTGDGSATFRLDRVKNVDIDSLRMTTFVNDLGQEAMSGVSFLVSIDGGGGRDRTDNAFLSYIGVLIDDEEQSIEIGIKAGDDYVVSEVTPSACSMMVCAPARE